MREVIQIIETIRIDTVRLADMIQLAAIVTAVGVLILCTAEDIFRKSIHLWKTGIFMAVNLLLALCEQMTCQSMIAGVIIGIVFMLVSISTKGKLGKGDAILIMGAGIYLGFGGILMVVFCALLLCSGYGLFLLWRKRGMSYEIAFVPFMLVPYTAEVILQFCGRGVI